MNTNLDKLINDNLEDVISIRREIHMNPELGMEEFKTAKLVADELRSLGIEVTENVGNTGVVGLLRGIEEGKTILLRADMDALPMDEETDLEFKSQVPGKMHACGHDVHTATLLGVAKVLSSMKDSLKGNVKFMFQPAEESNPTGGARYMIEDGILENPKVDRALGLHVWNLPVGVVALRDSTMMAQSDRLFITIKGKSAHASQPQSGADAIVAAAQVITGLQSVISRNVDPLDSAVITIGKINGGSRYNVISDKVVLEGTVRIFDNKVAEVLPSKIENVAKGIALAMGCEAEVEYIKGYSLTVNDKEFANETIRLFKDLLGEENVVVPDKPATGGEDFSEISKRVPSVYYWVGMISEKNKNNNTLHNPTVVIDEDCMFYGIKTMCAATLDYLK